MRLSLPRFIPHLSDDVYELLVLGLPQADVDCVQFAAAKFFSHDCVHSNLLPLLDKCPLIIHNVAIFNTSPIIARAIIIAAIVSMSLSFIA